MDCQANSERTFDIGLPLADDRDVSSDRWPNRRREVRRAAKLACRVSARSDGKVIALWAVDLSPQGMLLLSDARLDPADRLLVSFHATEIPIWFDTEATVARVVEGRRAGDRGRALGIRFESLSAVSRLILRGHFNRLPPTAATREVPPGLVPPRIDYAAELRRILDA
ncbi:MAG: PilZ domain-containing protein [Myxococcota bacterium]|nr:PilZ domain-containing protein [Myxococcota bacterium]